MAAGRHRAADRRGHDAPARHPAVGAMNNERDWPANIRVGDQPKDHDLHRCPDDHHVPLENLQADGQRQMKAQGSWQRATRFRRCREMGELFHAGW